MSVWHPPSKHTTRYSRITGNKNTYLKNKRKRKFSDITKEWINLIPKTINENGCWISNKTPHRSGYVDITIKYKVYQLHRLVICIYENLDYNDISWESRHGRGCSRACFNPEHLKSGTRSENMRDRKLHKKC